MTKANADRIRDLIGPPPSVTVDPDEIHLAPPPLFMPIDTSMFAETAAAVAEMVESIMRDRAESHEAALVKAISLQDYDKIDRIMTVDQAGVLAVASKLEEDET